MDQALAQIRPILSLIGSIVIIIGLVKFMGINIPVNGSGLEIAVAGWLTKNI
jgi:hypothetical protein